MNSVSPSPACDVEANIATVRYFTAMDGAVGRFARQQPSGRYDLDEVSETVTDKAPPALDMLTFCVLVLKDGRLVTGESFQAEDGLSRDVGRTAARANAVQKAMVVLALQHT